MNMLASLTPLLVSSPSGCNQLLRVTLLDRKTQLEHSGANISKPPGRVFHTWAREADISVFYYRWMLYTCDLVAAASMVINPTVRIKLWLPE